LSLVFSGFVIVHSIKYFTETTSSLICDIILLGLLTLVKLNLDSCKKPLCGLANGGVLGSNVVPLYLPALINTSFSFTITSALPRPHNPLSPGSGNTPL
jgi:hypothetical protein